MSVNNSATIFAIRRAVKYARKDFDKNIPRILRLLETADVKKVNATTYTGIRQALNGPDNNWIKFAHRLICDTNEEVLNKMIAAALNVAINSYIIEIPMKPFDNIK